MALSNLQSGSARPRRAILFWVGISLLVAVALSAAAALTPRFPGDLWLARWVQAFGSPSMDALMRAVTFLGDEPLAVGSILGLAGVLALARRWKDAAAFLGVLVLEVFMQGVKLVVDRPRPSVELVGVLESSSSGSFPSGHAYHAVVFWGLVLVLLVLDIRPWWLRRAVESFVLALVVITGISRVYLGSHWPSDVLGSVLWGVPSVALLVFGARRLRRQQQATNEGL